MAHGEMDFEARVEETVESGLPSAPSPPGVNRT